MQKPLKTFICYAREDHDAVDDLRKHLKQAEKNKILEIWDDGEILAGQNWDKAIKIRLKTAQIILMLVSVDFINSDYIGTTELQAALKRHRDGEATLIPIIVRRCDWNEHFGIGQFQALPKEARPIKSVELSIREEIYYEVAQGIKSVAQEIHTKIAVSSSTERQRIKDKAAWKAVKELNTLEAYENYLEDGNNLHQEEAQICILDITEAEAKRKAEAAAQRKLEAKRLREAETLLALEKLEKEIEEIKNKKNYAVQNQNYEDAANLRDAEIRLVRQMDLIKVEAKDMGII